MTMVKPPRPCTKIDSQKSFNFFKVYLPDRSSKILKIPKDFSKYLKGVIPFNSIITSSSKGSWRVDVKEFDDRIVFDEGWPDFVKDHSLEFEDFLVFSYDGDSKFNVTVFGQNHCIKEVGVAMETDRMTRHLHDSMQIQENNGAFETPFNIDSGNPFFESVLRPTYARGIYMVIPLGFQKRYMKKDTPTAMLKCANNKSWLIKLAHHSYRVVFGDGWGQFVIDNNLKEGDTCRFELIQTDGYIFNFSIRSGFEESLKFVSEYPFFRTVLRKGFACRSSMHIPAPFWKQNMNMIMCKSCRSATLIYSKRLWSVMIKCSSRRNHYICGGWSIFAKENNLQVGNICHFELIDRENLVFKVSVTV